MKKLLLVFALVALLALGCNAQNLGQKVFPFYEKRQWQLNGADEVNPTALQKAAFTNTRQVFPASPAPLTGSPSLIDLRNRFLAANPGGQAFQPESLIPVTFQSPTQINTFRQSIPVSNIFGNPATSPDNALQQPADGLAVPQFTQVSPLQTRPIPFQNQFLDAGRNHLPFAEPCNYNGRCDLVFGETCVNCPNDCYSWNICCGDAVCDSGAGENVGSCPTDCSCGDGVCNFHENCISCPSDCSSPLGTCCGNHICDDSENIENCRRDCSCGNGVCEKHFGEYCINCPNDCKVCTEAQLLQGQNQYEKEYGLV